ncbi:squalene/phytoene synthase family protein [Candidatus Pelagibacter bacterium]|nr:squalene/phytoene synthase family protein [Candidatus Pelagibacter bacterium]MDB2698767.1 squalene/phytoene synthase family protein [Candidatus Pelagibacter bacterium]MDC1176092.1 squalene/phytoene synthase family protein [Candidatus Pelagibacter sp.]
MADQSYLSIYAKSFNWAGFFLPKKTYLKCSALYDFCRVADNIADSNEAIEIKKIKFLDFQNDFNNKKFDNPIIKNMWQLINEFDIPLKVVHDLLDGINSDIQQSIKLLKKKDLLLYSYRVAGTVGLMMAKILRVNKKNSLKSAIDLGIAMQLTNISRDVIEDLNFGRSYINLNFEEIRSTIKLSESYYENSFYSIKEIPFAFRFAILVARRVYRKIGYKILKQQNLENYKQSGKIYVTNIEKIVETFCSVYDLIKLFLINKSDNDIEHNHSLIREEINLDERI